MDRRDDALQLQTDLDFHRREAVAQRVGWVLMLSVVVLAAFGLFGVGPLASTSASAPDGTLRAAYQRFVRFSAPTTVELQVGAEAVQDGRAEVWLSREYLEAFQVESILPEPESVEASAEGVTFSVALDEPFPAPVRIEVKPDQVGPHAGNVGVRGGPVVRLSQFVFP